MQLILASHSPRRRKLVERLGIPVHVVSANVDEDSLDQSQPADYVVQTAILKAEAVAAGFPAALIIAADTTVAIDDGILAKPHDDAEATAMLRRLRGRAHQVHTGIVVFQPAGSRLETSVCKTDVTMRDYSDDEIRHYVASGDPFDKAGAYAIQHRRFHPVAEIHGCYTNVVGLAMCHLCRLLKRFQVQTTLTVAADTCKHQDCGLCRALMSADEL